MREIIFRGKCIDDGEWAYGDYYSTNEMPQRGEIGHYIKCGLNEEYRVVPETVGQYIGIKDKNNIEIYENDLIKLDAVIFQVKWSKLLAGFVCKFDDEHESFACYQTLYKIVGNIHDNPEM